jgi:potassium-transporting ATPase potassium-binding subunit
LQSRLPINLAHLGAVASDAAFNTAISFATNTSWQDYSGETTLGHTVQMIGITSQSFLSVATGIAALVELLRGFPRVGARTLGNVWVDLTRSTLYVLLPLGALLALLLVSQGVIQSLSRNRVVTLFEPVTYAAPQLGPDAVRLKDAQGETIVAVATARTQTLPMGPVASQTAVALLSGDGGGFFNANSAHPIANPTPFSNFLEMLAILLIPAALCHAFGKAVGDARQGWAILSAMAAAFILMSTATIKAEQAAGGRFAQFAVDQMSGPLQAGGNMEGKEAALRSFTGRTRHRGLFGGQAPSGAGTGDASHTWVFVCGSLTGHSADHRRTDLRAGACAGAHRRTIANVRRDFAAAMSSLELCSHLHLLGMLRRTGDVGLRIGHQGTARGVLSTC